MDKYSSADTGLFTNIHERERSDILIFLSSNVGLKCQGEPFCSGFLSLMQLWPVSNDPWHQRQSIQLISPVAPTHWGGSTKRESMNKRFFLRTVYSLFFPAGGGQKRCPTMWPKWMWPKSSAFIFGITPKWEDGRHTRFIFTPHLWHLRRTYNCPGNTQTEDGQGLGVSHQDSKGWWRKYSPSDMFSICFMTYNDLWWYLWILRILAIEESLWVCGLVEGVPRSGML